MKRWLYAVIVMLGTRTLTAADLHCGAYCLYVALKTVGAPVGSLAELRQKLGPPDRSGYSLGRLQDAAAGYGTGTMSVHTTLDRLSLRMRPFAVIAHLPEGHFVNIVEQRDGDVVIVNAPDIETVSRAAFLARWHGDALLVSMQPLEPEESLHARTGWRTWTGWTLLAAGIVIAGGRVWATRGRRPGAALTVLLLISGQGCADKPTTDSAGRLRVVPREIDLGDVVQSSDWREAAATLENVGSGPLELAKIMTSCSCLVADSPPSRLEPGRTATVIFRVRPDQPGEGAKRAIVYCSDPLAPRVDVLIRWNAVPRVLPEVTEVDFGVVRPETTADRKVRIAFKEPNLRLGRPEFHSDGTVFADVESFEDHGFLHVALRSGKDAGAYSKTVRLPVEGCDSPPVKVLVHWQVRDVVSAIPPRLALGSVRAGGTVSRRIRLVSTSGAIVVDGVEVVGIPGCTARTVIAGEESTVQVEWTPGEAGIQTGVLRIHCSRPGPAVLAIPLSGHVSLPAGWEPAGLPQEVAR